METQNYKTQYEIVYSNNRRDICSSEQFGEMEFPSGYEAAAIKVILHNDKVSTKDEIIKDEMWVDADMKNYRNLAIEKRKEL